MLANVRLRDSSHANVLLFAVRVPCDARGEMEKGEKEEDVRESACERDLGFTERKRPFRIDLTGRITIHTITFAEEQHASILPQFAS